MYVFLTEYGCLAGLGRLRELDDELVMQVLSLLPAQALGKVACVNKALYCFANHEDLWRALVLEASCPSFHIFAGDHTCTFPVPLYQLRCNAPTQTSSAVASARLVCIAYVACCNCRMKVWNPTGASSTAGSKPFSEPLRK